MGCKYFKQVTFFFLIWLVFIFLVFVSKQLQKGIYIQNLSYKLNEFSHFVMHLVIMEFFE
jgi:hypothetical protein